MFPKIQIFIIIILLFASFSGGYYFSKEDKKEKNEQDVTDITYEFPFDDVRWFNVTDSNGTVLDQTPWAIFTRAQGGNGAEHYLATTKSGWITNLGGEYPYWSEDGGLTWDYYAPLTEQFDGLGEGAIIEAPNGDILAMSWYPYSGDRFISYLYDSNVGRWNNNMFEREYPIFYDRPWIAAVQGPINTLTGTYPWASLVTSNFYDDVLISIDGLNYEPLPDPSTAQGTEVFNLDFKPGHEYDFLTPHREIDATTIPTGGLLLPRYFGDENAILRTDLTWGRHRQESGVPIPAPHLVIDSSGALHSVEQDGDTLYYHISLDGGKTWNASEVFEIVNASHLEEWEFQADGENELSVIYMRSQVEDVDKDVIFHIRDYRSSLEPDSITMIGQGDLDATSGLGNDIRFDFASLAILPDGRSIVAYQDSTDVDPLFAVELVKEDYEV